MIPELVEVVKTAFDAKTRAAAPLDEENPPDSSSA